jgi:hypothetical protein
MSQQQQQQQLNVDLSQAEDVGCTKCENLYFTPVVMIKRLSALLSPTGQEVKFPVQGFQCTSCKTVETPFSE